MFKLITLISSAVAATLPALGTSIVDNTVSGFSSGADMTSIMMVAYSSSFKGAGIYAGMPYFCCRGLGMAGIY
jgi:poly(3-hydroxybutyrate) depolymerase